MAGRKRKPDEVKIIQGTFQKCRQKNKTSYKRVDKYEPPNNLNGRKARAYWRRIARELDEIGILKTTDVEWLYQLCNAYVELEGLRDAWETMKGESKFAGYLFKTKTGYLAINPLFSQMMKAEKNFVSLLSEGGMTPAARGRVEAEKPKETADPMEALLEDEG